MVSGRSRLAAVTADDFSSYWINLGDIERGLRP
jgi:hypothetical protein